MCRQLQRQKLTLKKTLRSSQAATESTQVKRLEYWESIRDIAPENLVFLDEMAILLGMMRDRCRSLEGERLYDIKPYDRGSRVTAIGAISQDKVLAIKVLGKSMTGEEFKEFLQEELAPQLWQGAGVVMDNLAAHKVAGVAEILEAVGAKVIYNAPYSCEFNPIEHLWWSLKAFIRNFVPKTAIAVAQLLKIGVMLCSSSQLRNYFIHCCYCPS